MILNTKTKTITPEGETFGEIYHELQKMRPDDWAQFMIEPQTITVEKWETFPIYPNPIYPDTTPWYDQWRITCQDVTNGRLFIRRADDNLCVTNCCFVNSAEEVRKCSDINKN